ncbi:MAG: hypothetical protein ACI9IA_000195 [Enterobacterales bacterium]|jgi:hypothetical protein
MKAFTNTVITKQELMKELRIHAKMDNFAKGYYFDSDSGKGCAVGCSIESINRLKGIDTPIGDHSAFPKLTGIPEWLARVEDSVFEGLSDEDSKKWVIDFTDAINVGSDLDKIKNPFLIKIVESTLDLHNSKRVKKYQLDVIEYIKGNMLERPTRVYVSVSAYASAYAAYASASASAYAYDYASDSDSDYAYADSASASAASAVSVSAYASAYASGRQEHYKKLSIILIDLIKNCKE